MMSPYMTLSAETEIVHSQLIEDKGIKKVIVNFERPTDNGFDSARCELPEYKSHSLKNCSIAMLIYYTNTLQMEE